MKKTRLVLFLLSAGIFGLVLSNVLNPDTPIEEVIEEVIQNETGADIDLSPGKGNKY